LFRDTPKGYVTQTLAGQRVAQVVVDPEFSNSGVHWSWGNRQVPGRAAFAQPLSAKATQLQLGIRLWELSNKLTGISA
jgi:protochlorophyllide reductase